MSSMCTGKILLQQKQLLNPNVDEKKYDAYEKSSLLIN